MMIRFGSFGSRAYLSRLDKAFFTAFFVWGCSSSLYNSSYLVFVRAFWISLGFGLWLFIPFYRQKSRPALISLDSCYPNPMTLTEAHAENLSRIWDALFKRRSPESYGLSRDGLVIIEPIQNTNPQIPPSLGGWQFKVVNPKYELMLKVSHHGGEAYSVALFENSKQFDALRTVFADSSDLRGLPEVVERFITAFNSMMRNL